MTARGITIRQPWAHAVVELGKDVENRSRNIAGAYRGPLLIHAAKTIADLTPVQESLLEMEGDETISAWLDGEPIVGGAIVGVVDLIDVHNADTCVTWHGHVDLGGDWAPCSHWAERIGWHLVLANPRRLDTPLPWKGALGLWTAHDLEIVGDWIGQAVEPPVGHYCGPYGCPPSCVWEPVARLEAIA